MKEHMNKTLVMIVMCAFVSLYLGYRAYETWGVRYETSQYLITHKWNWVVTTDTISPDELFKLQQLEQYGKSVYSGKDFYTVVNAKGDSYNIISIEDIGGVGRRKQEHKNYFDGAIGFFVLGLILAFWLWTAELKPHGDYCEE